MIHSTVKATARPP